MIDKLRKCKSRAVTAVLGWGLVILPALIATPPATAQTFKLLYAFTGGADGGGPWGAPLLTGGNLYATTFYSGSPTSESGAVFEYFLGFSDGVPYYDFAGQPYDGAAPMGGVITDGFGDFFGSTTKGGFGLDGTLYEISNGTESVIANFRGSNGAAPEGSLLMDVVGDLYGTTSQGGANDSGTVWAFSPYGAFITLYSFGNYQGDGVNPASNLILRTPAPDGVPYVILYGTTTEGGAYGWGCVFSINVTTKTENLLYSFHGGPDGGTPVGGLALDGKGNIWGTTSAGGSANGNAGHGVVFRLNLSTHAYKAIHTFSGTDGSEPMGALITDGDGNFYGTTFDGGAHGYGTVFKLSSAGVFTSLYNFTNGTDGAYPYGGVTLDSSDNVYGAATGGGQYGWGTLFEITP